MKQFTATVPGTRGISISWPNVSQLPKLVISKVPKSQHIRRRQHILQIFQIKGLVPFILGKDLSL